MTKNVSDVAGVLSGVYQMSWKFRDECIRCCGCSTMGVPNVVEVQRDQINCQYFVNILWKQPWSAYRISWRPGTGLLNILYIPKTVHDQYNTVTNISCTRCRNVNCLLRVHPLIIHRLCPCIVSGWLYASCQWCVCKSEHQQSNYVWEDIWRSNYRNMSNRYPNLKQNDNLAHMLCSKKTGLQIIWMQEICLVGVPESWVKGCTCIESPTGPVHCVLNWEWSFDLRETSREKSMIDSFYHFQPNQQDCYIIQCLLFRAKSMYQIINNFMWTISDCSHKKFLCQRPIIFRSMFSRDEIHKSSFGVLSNSYTDSSILDPRSSVQLWQVLFQPKPI